MAKEKRTKREVVGELALDFGKLTFGGLVLAGIFNTSLNKTVLISGGLLFCLVLVFAGVYFLTKK